MSQTTCNTNTVPLHKVAAAAMVDVYGDINNGGTLQLFQHWAARGLKKLSIETLKLGRQKALIYINPNTKTGTLPPDFGGELFVGIINNSGQKVPVKIHTNLTDTNNIKDLTECVDKCEKCNQNKAICQELSVTEETTNVVINGATYDQTVIKKLYPNGDYYLETSIPVLNVETDNVEFSIQKEFITSLDLKACGCIEESEANIEKIQCVCPEVYCNHYAPCCSTDLDAGYQIFEESGLIKVSANFPFNKIYIEYKGYIPKKNGQYQVPQIAFETLVEYVKFKQVDGKQNVSRIDKQYRFDRYRIERENMNLSMGRMSFATIMEIVTRLPKFDWHTSVWDSCCTDSCQIITPPSTASAASASVPDSNNVSPAEPNCDCPEYVPFDIATIVGVSADSPTAGSESYQNDKLKSAIGITFIIVNNAIYTIKAGEVVLDTDAGTITRPGNVWQTSDVLIVPTFFKYI